MHDADTLDNSNAYSPDTIPDVVGPPLRWPPPGLESIQGLAWRAVVQLAIGAGIMIAPLLLSVVATHGFWSAGPFGGSWWVPVVAALLGLLITLAGMERLTRILFEGVKAVQRGHDWTTVAYVVSDGRNDAGFLLQGARMYSTLEERDRRMVLAARVVAALGYTIALLWIAFMFPFGVVLAGRGLIGSSAGLTLLVLLPAILLLIGALLAHAFETNMTRAMQNAWHRNSGRDARLIDEVKEWRADRATRLIHLTPVSRRTTPARVAAIALIVSAVVLPVPIATLAFATALGPALTPLAVPRLDSSASRVAKATMLEPYALSATGAMTPLEAGEALHALALTGAYGRRSPLEREPVRRFDAWPHESKPVTLPGIELFGTQLIPRAAALTATELAYLNRVAEHPAHAELSQLARVRDADIAGGRWNTDRLTGTSMFEMPVAQFGGLRDAAHFHVAIAVLQLARGDAAGAETTLREIISVGLLVTRNSTTLIDALVGTSIAASGAAALQSLYHATGRIAEADALRRPNEGIEAMADITRALRADADLATGIREAMAVTGNETLPRGIRWEALAAIQLSAACLNPHTIVFGQGEQYASWLERTRSSLVRYPAEAALFELTLHERIVPRTLDHRTTVIERLLGITLGNSESTGRCAELLTTFAASTR